VKKNPKKNNYREKKTGFCCEVGGTTIGHMTAKKRKGQFARASQTKKKKQLGKALKECKNTKGGREGKRKEREK